MDQGMELEHLQMLALPRTSFDALRRWLMGSDATAGASRLQDAGFAGGGAMYESFTAWLAERSDADPGSLPAAEFAARASDFFAALGWGSFSLGSLGESVATVDSPNWTEADPARGLAHPGCHMTSGLLAGFFSAAGNSQIAALEVECRSSGSERCRFLIGAGALLTHVFDRLERGASYEQALHIG